METRGHDNQVSDHEFFRHGSSPANSRACLFYNEREVYPTQPPSKMPGAIPLEASIEIPVIHCEQRYNWDCGIACLFMAISAEKRDYLYANFEAICKEEGFGDCVWTIDLAYLLQRLGVPHLYCTITCGVDPGYKKEAFYTKVMTVDEKRVNQRFQKAPSNSVNIALRTVTLTDILEHLSAGKLLIVLVNANFLRCDKCFSYMYPPSTWFSCFKCNVPYHGHFILLCGFHHSESQILYRNPSFKDRVCRMSYSAFEEARKSYGTDEDIIFINPNMELMKTSCAFR